MQVVIDIREAEYDDIIYLHNTRPLDLTYYERKIAKGTVLPEEHGRIIDEKEFTSNVVKYSRQSTKTIGTALAETKTIIEATGASKVAPKTSDDVISIEIPADADKPGRFQTSDGVWHTGMIPPMDIKFVKIVPTKKKGKWILHPDHDAMECSECGSTYDEFLEADYCPIAEVITGVSRSDERRTRRSDKVV